VAIIKASRNIFNKVFSTLPERAVVEILFDAVSDYGKVTGKNIMQYKI
jgi:hypothetical protein